MIVVHCVKKKVHYSEADVGAAITLRTSSNVNIEQSNLAYNINDCTNGSATEMQNNVAYARSSANFNAPIVRNGSFTDYDTIQEESNDDYI